MRASRWGRCADFVGGSQRHGARLFARLPLMRTCSARVRSSCSVRVPFVLQISTRRDRGNTEATEKRSFRGPRRSHERTTRPRAHVRTRSTNRLASRCEPVRGATHQALDPGLARAPPRERESSDLWPSSLLSLRVEIGNTCRAGANPFEARRIKLSTLGSLEHRRVQEKSLICGLRVPSVPPC